MSKKTTTKKTSRAKKGAGVATQTKGTAKDASPAAVGAQAGSTARTKANTAPPEDLVVFAFRLTEAERKAIHTAAGPGKASKFVRALATHAAQGDVKTVAAMVEAVKNPKA